MRIVVLMGLLVTAGASAQTTTNCYRDGAFTSCTSSAPPQPQNWTALLPKPPSESVADYAQRMMATRQQQEQMPKKDLNDTLNVQEILVRREERRREAYNQVGAVIARGDCAAARRLAAFYGVDELVSATAKACP